MTVEEAGPSGGSPSVPRTNGTHGVWTVAVSLSGSVLGAGMLLMPSVVWGNTGPASFWAWGTHLVLGTWIALLLAVVVIDRPPDRLSGTVSGLLHPSAGRLVDTVYAAAFTFGQAAIAWFAALCVLPVLVPFRASHAALGATLACGVLVAASLLAVRGPAFGSRAARARRWLTGLVALGCAFALVPAAEDPDVLTADVSASSGFWLTLAALFFAGVGWESVTVSVPEQARRGRRAVAGVLLGSVIVASVYSGLAAVHHYAADTSPFGGVPDAVRYTLAVLVLLLSISYCATNIRTAAAIASRALSTERAPASVPVWLVGLVCLLWVWPAAREGGVVFLLLGPAAGAWTAYTVAAVAIARGGTARYRFLGSGLVVVLLVIMAGTLHALSPF
ncbi:APC family permease [Nocardiopsis xinjiangensis]|uniref:hypothetical protein n=1 Tax=Nocardiopsis xinjiangensis TaxID=124285 RepID=UPI000361EA29|nr:hypothetical protein [Nocardiopsis xinjiangensis]